MNKTIFNLIQQIQSREMTAEAKMEAFKNLEKIDDLLDTKMHEVMKIKGDKPLKKLLMEEIVECREGARKMLNALRQLKDFSNISN